MKPDEQVDELNVSPSFARLPHLVLYNIFRHLCAADIARVGRVCSEWYHASRDPGLWKTVNVNTVDLTPSTIEKLLQFLPPHISYLRLQCLKCPRKQTKPLFTAANAHKLKRNCYNLETLIIENALLTTYKSEMDFEVECLPINLQVLSLRGSIFRTDYFFSNISASQNIRVMDFTACLCLRDHHIPWFSRMQNLEELYLAGCPITQFGFIKLFELSVSYLSSGRWCNATRNTKLKVLDLEGTEIGDEIIFVMQRVLPRVEKLYLGGIKITKDRFVHSGQVIYQALHTICLRHAQVSSEVLNLLSKVKSLKCIKLANRDASINALQEADASLKEKFQFMDVPDSLYCNHFMMRDASC